MILAALAYPNQIGRGNFANGSKCGETVRCNAIESGRTNDPIRIDRDIRSRREQLANLGEFQQLRRTGIGYDDLIIRVQAGLERQRGQIKATGT